MFPAATIRGSSSSRTVPAAKTRAVPVNTGKQAPPRDATSDRITTLDRRNPGVRRQWFAAFSAGEGARIRPSEAEAGDRAHRRRRFPSLPPGRVSGPAGGGRLQRVGSARAGDAERWVARRAAAAELPLLAAGTLARAR